MTTAERDAKLIEANDGRKILDPTSFSYKPEIKFEHKQPSIKVASAYGWSFMPPQFWSVPQKNHLPVFLLKNCSNSYANMIKVHQLILLSGQK